MYDLAIIGGGPAGVAAGVYASRKRLKTVFITKDFLGQSSVSDGGENRIGTIKIPGTELSKNVEEHLRAYAGDVVDIKTGGLVEQVSKGTEGFLVKTTNGEFTAKTVLITTGSYRRRLEAKGADAFEHKGLTYCATCDGPLFSDQDVVVVGGGNAALESAAQLLAYCKSVTIIIRGSEFRADPVTVLKLLKNPKLTVIKNAVITEVTGDKFVKGLIYKDASGEKELAVTGIFVEIGLLPNTGFVKDLVKLDDHNHIIVDPRTQRAYLLEPAEIALDARRERVLRPSCTSSTARGANGAHNEADEVISAGVWAAGDATDGLYHQNNIAAGDAVKALEDIYNY